MAATTQYVLHEAYELGLSQFQSQASLSVVNLNIGVEVDVVVTHRTLGGETFQLINAGDTLTDLPLADVTSVTISASSYPATILFVQTAVPGRISSPQSFAGSSGGGATVNVEQIGMAGTLLQQVITMTGAAIAIPTTALANRRKILLQAAPDNASNVYIGSATVTADETATGGPQLAAGASWSEWLGAAATLYAIGAAGTKLIVLEMS